MEQIGSIPDLIDLWHTTPLGRTRGANNALAADLEVKGVVVRAMRFRSAVDVKHWPSLIAAAERHAKDAGTSSAFRTVTADLLMRLHTIAHAHSSRSKNAAA